ncbi:MAG: DUF3108 domain-containing protein [Rhizobacter sp.]|nr:DUF3108 domain-containing protein [Rhizobacter sp.]
MDRRLTLQRGERPRSLGRRLAWLALVGVVLLLHAFATHELAARMVAFDLANAMPKRIQVAYVRTIEPEAPAVAPPAPSWPVARQLRPRAPRRALAASAPAGPLVAAASEPDAAASAPDLAASAIAPAAALAASAPASEPALASADAVDTPASAASPTISTPLAAASAPAVAPTFQWPGATRVSYVLTGNYRGEVSGSAQVEWIRVDERYQVNLDLVVGPEFAPIITRRMTSEGKLTPGGLVPERYDEDTQMVMRERRRLSVVFERDAVVLANGERRERLAGVQDTASQFVQLTFMFTTQPELLRVGNVVSFPLALPRTMDNYAYEVVDDQRVITPFGTIGSFHLKPQPQMTKRPNQLSAELWIAPELRYLPVRIRIEQDAQNYVDLIIARKPEVAGSEPDPATRATFVASSSARTTP